MKKGWRKKEDSNPEVFRPQLFSKQPPALLVIFQVPSRRPYQGPACFLVESQADGEPERKKEVLIPTPISGSTLFSRQVRPPVGSSSKVTSLCYTEV